jgi:hypothetical protein
VIDDDADLARCFGGAAKRWNSWSRRAHLGGTRRAAKTGKIESPDIEAVIMQLIGP